MPFLQEGNAAPAGGERRSCRRGMPLLQEGLLTRRVPRAVERPRTTTVLCGFRTRGMMKTEDFNGFVRLTAKTEDLLCGFQREAEDRGIPRAVERRSRWGSMAMSSKLRSSGKLRPAGARRRDAPRATYLPACLPACLALSRGARAGVSRHTNLGGAGIASRCR